MKILTVVGARPQFIKLAPVSRLLRRQHHEVLVHTGQHYDDEMSALFFRELELPEPDHNLGVGSGPHGQQTAAMLSGIERLVLEEKPDWVLVYGDTNSTLAGALAAAKLKVPLAHVEAGLRSYDKGMPEEINRVLADHVSDLCFCPTDQAVSNLEREGIVSNVHQVGDVMYDVFRQYAEVAARQTILRDLQLEPHSYLLATIHRAENVDEPARLQRILTGLGRAGSPVVLPIHPRTRAALQRSSWAVPEQIRLIDPVGYLEMLALEQAARLILTDSGGVQKEAYFVGVPCITLRDRTEWTETVHAGWNTLAGSDPDRIAAAVRAVDPPAARPTLFGDGRASEKIVNILAASRD